MQPSKYQQAILKWLETETGNATCNAVAGAGKSTTLKLAAQHLQKQGYQPREIKVIVFGKQNSLDLIAKFGRAWKESIKTLHSVGFSLLKQEVGQLRRDERVVSSKYRLLAEEFEYIPPKHPKKHNRALLSVNGAITKPDPFLKLIDLADSPYRIYRLNLSEAWCCTIILRVY